MLDIFGEMSRDEMKKDFFSRVSTIRTRLLVVYFIMHIPYLLLILSFDSSLVGGHVLYILVTYFLSILFSDSDKAFSNSLYCYNRDLQPVLKRLEGMYKDGEDCSNGLGSFWYLKCDSEFVELIDRNLLAFIFFCALPFAASNFVLAVIMFVAIFFLVGLFGKTIIKIVLGNLAQYREYKSYDSEKALQAANAADAARFNAETELTQDIIEQRKIEEIKELTKRKRNPPPSDSGTSPLAPRPKKPKK